MPMDCYELMEKVGGELVRGRARVLQGKEYVLLGELNGDRLEFTEAGRKMAAEIEKPKRARKPKTTPEELSSMGEGLKGKPSTDGLG